MGPPAPYKNIEQIIDLFAMFLAKNHEHFPQNVHFYKNKSGGRGFLGWVKFCFFFQYHG